MINNIKYTTCDRCGKRIDKILPIETYRYGSTVVLKEIEYKPDIHQMRLAIERSAKELDEGYPALVCYEGFIKKKEYDLCHSCAKELKAFFKARNEEGGKQDV